MKNFSLQQLSLVAFQTLEQRILGNCSLQHVDNMRRFRRKQTEIEGFERRRNVADCAATLSFAIWHTKANE